MHKRNLIAFAAAVLGVGIGLGSVFAFEQGASHNMPPGAADPGFDQRQEAKLAVVEKLAGGELSLQQAAQQFEERDATVPKVGERLGVYFQEASPTANRYQQVLAWVNSFYGDSTEGDEVRARLESQMQTDLNKSSGTDSGK